MFYFFPTFVQYERQMQREQTVDLTEKLDNKWKELRNVLASSLIKADKEVGHIK